MPRFVRDLADNGQELLSMNEILNYLIRSSNLLIEPENLNHLVWMAKLCWWNKGDVITYPLKKSCSVGVD